MFICVTHVDSMSKVPGFKRPMRNGPTFPDVKGLNIVWWDASKWPLTHPDQFPRFYGTCDDDADTSIKGVIEVLTEEKYNQLKAEEDYARLPRVVTPRQARLALLKANVYTDVVNAIEALEEPAKSAAKIEWEFSLEISKDSPFVKILATNLNWNDEFLSNLFVTASTIQTSEFLNNNEEE